MEDSFLPTVPLLNIMIYIEKMTRADSFQGKKLFSMNFRKIKGMAGIKNYHDC